MPRLDAWGEPTHFSRELVRGILLPIFKILNVQAETLFYFRIFFAFATIWFLAFMNDIGIVLFVIYQFVFMLDYVDGRLADLQHRFNKKYAKADRYLHMIISGLFLMAISFLFYKSSGDLGRTARISIAGLGILSSACVLCKPLQEADQPLAEVKRDSLVKGKNFLWYNFLRIDGTFTLFFFLVLFKLYFWTIIIYAPIQLIIMVRKVLTYG